MNQVTVKKWIKSGELNEDCVTQEDVLSNCGRLLVDSCSHEILGEVLFEGTDGKYYVITTEAMIQEANPEYVKEALENLNSEEDDQDE